MQLEKGIIQVLIPAVCLLAAAVVLFSKYRVRNRDRREEYPAVSVPEALRVLTHSNDTEKRKLAAEALCGIMYGEVTIIEELLDEVMRTHAEYCPARADGLTLLDIALEDMLQGSISAARLLLLCTEHDSEWPDEDEWNSFVQAVIVALRATSSSKRHRIAELANAGDSSNLAHAAAILTKRMHHERVTIPEGLFDKKQESCLPDVLPFNTRFCCAECGENLRADLPIEKLRCEICKNVAYCSQKHANVDQERHAFWCCSHIGAPSSSSQSST
uniref:MYND-type domain-containing protein n=1 Tax=Aureoumbra lagunensis TaxID=44058 RepID=A0A7S3NI70_9STRA